jgi:two-component system alkaline phosphatase synthesis response regulator PhoP
MSSIVIIEDEKAIATGLAMNLRFEGHEVRCASDGPTGLEMALEPGTSLVVLDVMLPGMNGYEVLREIRRRSPRLAVLMLSARGAEKDKVLGLDLGADDYVTKPFGLAELLSRVKALLRRSQSPKTQAFGRVTVDLEAQVVRREGKVVEMTAQEFRLLRAFVESEGRTLSREHLLDAAWGLSYEGTARTVDTFVRQLRVKIEDDAESPRHLLTVRGLGYRFEA